MDREAVVSKNAPKAIGPYAQAVRVGNLIYTSGQIPIHPQTNQTVEGGIEEQTRRVLENLKSLLEDAGTSMKAMVKTTIFLANMDDFAKVNEIYASYFDREPPARSCIQVAGLPKGALIEVEGIAVIK
ncbi:2-iminobutanoate/2-iminopropanoate deaminase [Candidatus Hakubella thermalkaliphila]|uniref:2-iminobutanoate/2-iminopropanoate deaminase n=1 Tax=Candidatus Hakubella thermalkaliphila TaxID=2754717 RepID=A0A6V8Q850_9ACTN|nr:RidA family protein [Candidatus Hakubella thermalkaliphila]GFP20848.1 2-iminobutanoate/2-iminopropanoate deaminase [Candidatus Hakubella thermalkaliphila]GFP40912.1 2-iminobutanoate/2-iminopropanoate deaminase [Candidatus Hakubella thermalkaliphila]